MTKPHPAHLAFTGLLMLLSGLPLASRAGEPLIVVEDRGGTSALPYYEALNLQPRANAPARPSIPTPQLPATPADEAAMLPVRSAKLTPGTVARRVIEAPRLPPVRGIRRGRGFPGRVGRRQKMHCQPPLQRLGRNDPRTALGNDLRPGGPFAAPG